MGNDDNQIKVEVVKTSPPPHSYFKTLSAVLGVFVLVAGLGIAVRLSQQKQDSRTKASVDMVDLSVSADKNQVVANETVNFAIGMVTHNYKVNAMELNIKYDQTKFDFVSFTKTEALPVVLTSAAPSNGLISYNLGVNPGSPVAADAVVANLVLKAKSGVSGEALVQIDSSTQVAGIDANGDPVSTNLLGDTGEALVNISLPASSPAPSASPAATPTPVYSLSSEQPENFTLDKYHGIGFYVVLKKDNVIIVDQNEFSYTWTIDNNLNGSISITPDKNNIFIQTGDIMTGNPIKLTASVTQLSTGSVVATKDFFFTIPLNLWYSVQCLDQNRMQVQLQWQSVITADEYGLYYCDSANCTDFSTNYQIIQPDQNVVHLINFETNNNFLRRYKLAAYVSSTGKTYYSGGGIGAVEVNGPYHCPVSSPTPTPTSAPVVKIGDANGDGKVDGADYTPWVLHYGETTANKALDGDFNEDGRVDGVDYSIWLLNYQ